MWKVSTQMEQLQLPSGASCAIGGEVQLVRRTHGQPSTQTNNYLHGRDKAVHVVTTVAIVAEQQLVVILGGPTH